MKKYHVYLKYNCEGEPEIGCKEFEGDYNEDDESSDFYIKYIYENNTIDYCLHHLANLFYTAVRWNIDNCMYDAMMEVKAIFEERIQYVLQNTYENVEFIGIKDDDGNFSFRKPREGK
ncbi:MAG: hypothetical protein MJZ34_13950 [Paludibacteraceae bacterium]|nr:hypothetical protein [Paludibacteraceae bacterium]